ncbi:protein tyrosine kinase [Nocardia otitidiscaviarum]|uniref:Wzz/FepE/Etk N-terminal domain-containing protein n=1 Tax=Nocardia otitidiscaviarum TaxID=1823 RepID=UPI0004A74321|nr:Wzz/FepE/Etk N-terminal domain-containing protein [Nocardia otitidiscaviarum]MBF6136759.1 protein tyrosine kinase [Nocardia otitidiscaviarum]MBF6484962.1 protein tyrosine kinase [Nocardia otitidiscaviarum]
MGLTDYLHLFRRRWPVIVAAVVLCVVAAAGYARSQPTTYSASSSVYVSMATGTSVNDSYQGGLAAQQRVRSYIDLATSVTVAQYVKDQLGLPDSVNDLRGRITAAAPPATTIIIVSVTDDTADGARILADEVVSQLRALISRLESIQADAAPAARAVVIDKAQTPTQANGPQTTRMLALGVIAGLLLGLGGALAWDRLDKRLRTSNDLEAILPVPILGIIDDGRPGAAGETRRLRTRLTADPERTSVLFTALSPHSEPEVALGLARSLADTGARVVLVDADTSGRGSSRRIPVGAAPGLAELLRNSSSTAEAVVLWPEVGISVLPLGVVDLRTPDLLASERFAEIMSKLRTEYDHIIVEAAPVTAAADAIALARRCDATVGIVELGRTTSAQVRGALATFGANDPRLAGVVVFSRPGGGLQRLLRRTPTPGKAVSR